MKKNLQKTLESIPYYIHHYGFFEAMKLTVRFVSGATIIALKGIKNGIHIRKGSSDIPTFHSIFAFREYDLKMIATPPKVIIDGGANIGLFSVFMKNRYPDARIIAVEPDGDNHAMAVKNLQGYNDVTVIKSGLWNKSALLKVHDKFNQGKWAMVVEETTDQNDATAVPAISINDIIHQYNLDKIDLLKLDIETAEKYLFDEGSEQWLPKVKTLVIELHDWIEPGCSQPLFNKINKMFPRFSYYIKGENTVFVNEELS